ncbi:hypothetical protein C8J57DRAFT_1233185 [Mycena rebaudengoi]|nr:hypothetical protein C8J57DRAFT_1262540 [Mycena rebaudengoi]KAJ7260172.1 hypothetical protein C8J57DRAFT_1233185 [Mycena rebaudengoi]
MYGGRCHGSGYIVHLTVVPNARCAFTIGHLYLDLVESTGKIRIQITVDGGTEPQYMFQLHEQLRSDNIPIEALWSYFLKYTGHDLKAAILLGHTENYINVTNKLHISIPLAVVQNRAIAVNQFVRYWNTHKARKQSSKYLPLGVAPEIFQHPESFGLCHAGIPVDLNVVRELRNMLPKSREDCFRWVPLDFDLRVRLRLTNLWEAQN